MLELYYRNKARELYAYLFGGAFVLTVIASATLAMFNAGPLILGSEMNANGTVEYLCLGRACESYQAMDW